ncbi:hypothetical protein [Solitalea lacus]|uniref:hypothetical protein n=1 Tax=Solitalea lacus TaxID=2911172 RepID=UPI001EDC6F71|nr:hypothetical protein [Solitalea lacus]UKJ08727.1 hypothetical protein L2B55_06040 [Solitalea lacus]
MKKLLGLSVLFTATLLASCSKEDDTKPTPVNVETNIRGVISKNITLTKDKIWTLRGPVYVTAGATITIEAGTKIISKKDSAGILVITPGSKINAAGTASAPIVFTSGEAAPAAGDFGGVVISGKATVNGNHKTMEGGLDPQYSAIWGATEVTKSQTSDSDNSGVLQYVRIEYAGKAVAPEVELNGLSLYGVGNGTTFDHIQITRGLDDAFEFFGGTFNAKYLIAYGNGDDDFDFDDGFRGNLQYIISIKDPNVTDAKGTTGDVSNNIECDNTDGKTAPYATTPVTKINIANATLVGPGNTPNSPVWNNYGYGARWRRGSTFNVANSIIIGVKLNGVSIESNEAAQSFNDGVSSFKNNILNTLASAPYRVGSDVTTVVGFNAAKVQELALTTSYAATADDVKLTDPFNFAKPNVAPKADSQALTMGTKFEGVFATGFDKPAYVGALTTAADWTAGWAAWGK